MCKKLIIIQKNVILFYVIHEKKIRKKRNMKINEIDDY